MAADGFHKETHHDEHQRTMDEEARATSPMHETKEGDSSPEKSPTRAGTDEQGAHMEWTFTRVVAIISLCFVYVGTYHFVRRAPFVPTLAEKDCYNLKDLIHFILVAETDSLVPSSSRSSGDSLFHGRCP